MFKKSLKQFLFIIPIVLIFFGLNYSDQLEFADFSGGLRNDITADLLADNESPDCENVIVNEQGNSLEKRTGFTLFKTLTSSSTYGCQGFTTFRDQSTGNDYFIVAHGTMVAKVDSSSTTEFKTDRTDNTYTDFTYDDNKIYGCNGYDYNWNYDGTTVISTATYSVTIGTTTTYPYAPKTFTHAFYQDRYFVACSTTSPNRVWQYYFNQPTNLSTIDYDNPDLAADQYDIGAAGERIVKLYVYNSGLMVFKSKSIYKIIGDGTPFQIIEITHNLGCQNPNSIIEDSGVLYFLGSDNYYYMYDGTSLYRLSEKIEGKMEDINNTIYLSTGGISVVNNSEIYDTYTQFDTGTSSHVYIDSDGTLTRQYLYDDFSDGDAGDWTAISGTISTATYTNSFTSKSQYYIGLDNGDKFSKSYNLSSESGYWYFDIYAPNYATSITSFYLYDSNFIYDEYLKISIDNSDVSILHYYFDGTSRQNLESASIGSLSNANIRCKLYIGEDNGANTEYKFYIKKYGESTYTEILNYTDYSLSITSKIVLEGNIVTSYITNIYHPLPITDSSHYTSSIIDLGNSYSFGSFNVNESLNGETISYLMRTNTSSTTLLTDSWITINKDEVPSLTNNKYVQFKSSFTTTDVTVSPELEKVTLNYSDNVSVPSVVTGIGSSKFFKNRMYNSVKNVNVSTASYTNYALIYDLPTNSWWPVSNLYAYDFAVLNNELYLADSRYGVILKQTESYNDYDAADNANNAIDSYYYTKQHYLGSPYNTKKLNYLAMAMKKQSTGSLLIDTLINGVTSSNQMTYSMTGTTPAKVYISNYPFGEIGYYYQWKFSNSEASTPFELFSYMSDYKNLVARKIR